MLPLDVAGTNADIIMAQMFYHDNFSTLLNWSTTVLTAVRQADSTLATGGLRSPLWTLACPGVEASGRRSPEMGVWNLVPPLPRVTLGSPPESVSGLSRPLGPSELPGMPRNGALSSGSFSLFGRRSGTHYKARTNLNVRPFDVRPV